MNESFINNQVGSNNKNKSSVSTSSVSIGGWSRFISGGGAIFLVSDNIGTLSNLLIRKWSNKHACTCIHGTY